MTTPSEARDSIDAATEELSGALERAAQALMDAGYNVTASVPIPGSDGARLGWGKISRSWELLYLSTDQQRQLRQPLSNASRHLRMAAADALPALQRELDEQMTGVRDALLSAAARARAFADQLQAVADSEPRR